MPTAEIALTVKQVHKLSGLLVAIEKQIGVPENVRISQLKVSPSLNFKDTTLRLDYDVAGSPYVCYVKPDGTRADENPPREPVTTRRPHVNRTATKIRHVNP